MESKILFGEPLEAIESMRVLSLYTGKTEKELNDVIRKNKKIGYFYINKERFVIRCKESKPKENKKPKRIRRKPEDMMLTNVIDFKDCTIPSGGAKNVYIVDGAYSSADELCLIAGISKMYLGKYTSNAKSFTINGCDVQVFKIPRGKYFTVDGAINCITNDLVNILNYSPSWIVRFIGNEPMTIKGHLIERQEDFIFDGIKSLQKKWK